MLNKSRQQGTKGPRELAGCPTLVAPTDGSWSVEWSVAAFLFLQQGWGSTNARKEAHR